MSGISKVLITQLFWDSLGQHRNHARYGDLRAKIAWSVRQKAADRHFSTNGDKMFTGPALGGVWHCKLSTNPDVVMFYTVDSDTYNLGMIGSHADYPYNGQHTNRGPKLRARVDRAIEEGHVPTPNWQRVRWERPEQLLEMHDLHEVSPDELERIRSALVSELDDAPIYLKLSGVELIEQTEQEIERWLGLVDQTLDWIGTAQSAAWRLSKERSIPAETFAQQTKFSR